MPARVAGIPRGITGIVTGEGSGSSDPAQDN